MLLRDDCRHFIGDRPCRPHKQEGVHCADCRHYETAGDSILIIKLDALGDVLRTTCILDALHTAHPGARIEWLTMEGAMPLFDGNPLLHRVHGFPGSAWVALQTQRYQLVINLDNAPLSSQLATLARGERKLGYGCDPAGRVFPFNPEAREWYEMGLFDDVKRRNTKTYQQIALEICGLPAERRDLHLYLSDAERAWAAARGRAWGLRGGVPVIGLNTGSSDRWSHKRWTEDGFVALIDRLRVHGAEAGAEPHVLLLGGPQETQRNASIARRVQCPVIDTGGHNTLREFFALIDLCDLMVTGDTLAMHAASALGKKVVALFGPTSVAEIDLYGRGLKLASDAPCVGGYRTQCDVMPTCMERISPAMVHDAVRELMAWPAPKAAPADAPARAEVRVPLASIQRAPRAQQPRQYTGDIA